MGKHSHIQIGHIVDADFFAQHLGKMVYAAAKIIGRNIRIIQYRK